ncbi:MAG TPA: DUF92 domain-containing protein [Firmicutes bacterium]|nr:DUF92 domain-containing protein [Bacillota bacterium]
MLFWGLGTSALVAGVAYRKGSLSESGFWGAVLVGTLIMGFGGLLWYCMLMAFFISGSALSHYKKERKGEVEANFAKTGRRDFGQALANGGLGSLLAVLSRTVLSPGAAFAMFLGVMATVSADTWATEIGVLSKEKPRSVLSWQEVPPGTSGGVSLLGTGAAVLGALLVGLVAHIGLRLSGATYLPMGRTLMAALVGGLAGCFTDSLLGASCQVIFRCPVCGTETEKREHCGRETEYLRGYRWLNNDLVNLLASGVGGLVALLYLA